VGHYPVSRVMFQQPAASVRERIEAGRNLRARIPRLQQARTPAL